MDHLLRSKLKIKIILKYDKKKKNIKPKKCYKGGTHVGINLIEKFVLCRQHGFRAFFPLLRRCIIYIYATIL